MSEPIAPRRDALLVATSHYLDDRLPDLEGPLHDAQAFRAVLERSDIASFRVDVVGDATEGAIKRKLEDFFTNRVPEDILLVHVAGHGLKDDGGSLFFAAQDTKLDRLRSTAIQDTFLHDVMEQSRSQRIILILDCCFGGAFSVAGKRRAAGAEAVGIKERFDGRGRVWITASNSTQYSIEAGSREGEPSRSLFTSALISGLESGAADVDDDGDISVDDLYSYAVNELRRTSSTQSPTKGGVVEGTLVIARNPFHRPKPRQLPGPVAKAMNSPDQYRRAGAVADLRRLANDPDESVRASAIDALRRLADDDHRLVADAARSELDRLAPVVARPPTIAEPPPPAPPAAPLEAPPPDGSPAAPAAPARVRPEGRPPDRAWRTPIEERGGTSPEESTSLPPSTAENPSRRRRITRPVARWILGFWIGLPIGFIGYGYGMRLDLSGDTLTQLFTGLFAGILYGGIVGLIVAAVEWVLPAVRVPDGRVYGPARGRPAIAAAIQAGALGLAGGAIFFVSSRYHPFFVILAFVLAPAAAAIGVGLAEALLSRRRSVAGAGSAPGAHSD